MVEKPGGQMVEQRLIDGGIPLKPEVARRGHQGRAEVPAPDAVDEHAGRERIVAGGDRAGQFQPAAPLLGKGLRPDMLEHAEKLPRSLGTADVRLAADVDIPRAEAAPRRLDVGEHHRLHRRSRMLLDELVELLEGGVAGGVFPDDPVATDPLQVEHPSRPLRDQQTLSCTAVVRFRPRHHVPTCLFSH
jgi:hypothetical protein